MQKWRYYLFVVIILGGFMLLMQGGNYLKSPFGENDDVNAGMRTLSHHIAGQDWQQAADSFQYLDSAWRTVVPRIQFSVEKDEINAINVNLARLKAYIQFQDQKNSAAELSEAREHWMNLNK